MLNGRSPRSIKPARSPKDSTATTPSITRKPNSEPLVSHKLGTVGSTEAKRVSDGVQKTKVSDRLNPKVSSTVTFGGTEKGKFKTAFSAAYARGGIPCRLVHGSIKHKVAWSSPLSSLAYDPILILMFEGLRETEHPYVSVVRLGLEEMLTAGGAREKILPLLGRVAPVLKGGLASSDKSTFLASLNILNQLARVVGTDLLPKLQQVLPPIAKRALEKGYTELVTECLHNLERQCGGAEALRLIKMKIPTYCSVG